MPRGTNGKPAIMVFGFLYGETHALMFFFGWIAFVVGVGVLYWLLKAVLRSGGLVAIPTETVSGIRTIVF